MGGTWWVGDNRPLMAELKVDEQEEGTKATRTDANCSSCK